MFAEFTALEDTRDFAGMLQPLITAPEKLTTSE
jgi:hypothetical protein